MEDVTTVTETENPVQVEGIEAEATPAEVPAAEAEKTNIEKSKEGTPKGVQKRIDELTARAKLAEEERESTRIEAEFWKNQASKPKEEEKPVSEISVGTTKPVLEDFADYDAYVEALTDWKIEQKEQVNRQAYVQHQQQERHGQLISSFDKKAATVVDALPDFEEVARNSGMRRIFSAMPHITDAIMESEKGPEIAYYLGKNRQKAIEMTQMHPIRGAIELGKIEARFLTLETKKISRAPEPINPVGGMSAAVDDEDNMSVEELAAKYKRQRVEKFNKRR